PIDIEVKLSLPARDVNKIPAKPAIKPIILIFETRFFKKIIDKTIVTNGAAPKIILELTPAVFVKPIAKNELCSTTLKIVINHIVFHSAFVGKRKIPIIFEITNTIIPAVNIRNAVIVIGSISFTSVAKAATLNPHDAITMNNKK